MLHCKVCKFVKDDNEFYKSNQSTCKDCVRAAVSRNRAANIEYYRAYDRARGNRQGIRYLKKYRSSNPKKYVAHCAVNNAIRDKKIMRLPCELCGEEPAHAHHDDYTKPLEVRWLCPAHHRQWHVQNGEAKSA